MCGIAGHIGLEADSDVTAALTQLHHRGPDEVQELKDATFHMGIQRLSIIDLTPGVQPVKSEDGRIVGVMNGEIYNHVELSKELRGAGYTLQSRTDAEVVPHLYKEYGDEFVSHLRGMFAVALWDACRGRLLLARDRFGKKPLYYRCVGGGIAFASEIKALRKMLSGQKWQLRDQSVYDYLSLGVVPQPDTVYEGVSQVAPGSMVIFENGTLNEQTYWSLGQDVVPTNITDVRRLIHESVSLRLRSDVPIGVFLSGGIDSNIVAYEAAKLSDGELRAYTVQMPDAALDESRVAVASAKKYGMQHEVLPMRIRPVEDLQEVVMHYDQPFADSSALACWAVARAAVQHLKVVLTGDGGDELFGGYRRHLAAYRLEQLPIIPKSVWRTMTSLLPRMNRRSRFGFLKRFTPGAGSNPGRRYLEWSTDLLLEGDKQRVWQRDAANATEDWIDSLLDVRASSLRQSMMLDVRVNLLSDLLIKMDMATMAHSLEARSPLLDQDLAAISYGLPDEELIQGGMPKSVLRRAYADVLPEAVVTASKKGFEVPVEQWLGHEWRELMHDVLGAPEPETAAFIDRQFIRDLLNDKLNGEWNMPMLKYTVLVLEMWLRNQKN